MHANQPHSIHTHQGDFSIELDIVDSNRGNREIPIVDVKAAILPGPVKDPQLLFGNALRECYELATQFLRVPASPMTDTVRMILSHPGLTNHAHMWSSNTHYVGHNTCLANILTDWEAAMQSGEELDLSSDSFTLYFQFVLTHPHHPAPHRVGARRSIEDTYEQAKKKMYNRSKLECIFKEDKTLLNIPRIPDKGICFPMAFLSCQCRNLIRGSTGTITHVVESSSEFRGNNLTDKECYSFIPCPELLQVQLQADLPFFICKDQIILFNPYIIQPEYLNQRQLALWIQLVEYIHQYVQSKLDRVINMNNLEEVCVAYAEVFQVIIHIRRLEIQGNRHQFFYHPTRKTALTAEKHITLMLVDECNVDHCHSMLDIRKWCQPYQTANRINVTGYCDYCCKVKTQNNRSKAQDLLHMNECRGAFYEPGFRPNIYEDHTFQQFQHTKETKNAKACYQCKLCQSKITHKYLLSNHLCYTPIPELKPPIANQKIFVFDLEAYQRIVEKQDRSELHVHEANLVCIRNVYSNDYRMYFRTIADFMNEILNNPIFHGSVILAHNGGSYDCQFIIQYLEANLIPMEKLQ